MEDGLRTLRHTRSVTKGATTDDESTLSARLIEQRVRNRVIEYFELVSSFERQRDYERVAAHINVPYEIINQWEDWVPENPRVSVAHLGCYSAEEIQALRDYHAAWEVAAEAAPDTYPSLTDIQTIPEWTQLTEAARRGTSCFARRGKLPEDRVTPWGLNPPP
jgi:hypothetical protein